MQPATVKEIQTVLFLRKLLRYIRDLINPREFQELEALIQQCNEIWEDRSKGGMFGKVSPQTLSPG